MFAYLSAKRFMRILFIAMFLCLIACKNDSGNSLATSDSLVIEFLKASKTINTTAGTAIRKIADYVEGKQTAQMHYSIDGKLLFYKQGAAIDTVFFNYSTAETPFFLSSQPGFARPVQMSNEAAAFLRGLAEGKSWY